LKRVALLVLMTFVLVLHAGTATWAQDRPIVYAARYYSPPSRPNVRTYSHLYRVNPDGTGRRQITFGRYNDTSPLWSPNGRQILFARWNANEGSPRLCLTAADGSGRTAVVAGPFSGSYPFYFSWSPDGRFISVCSSDLSANEWVSTTRIYDARTLRPLIRFSGAGEDAWQRGIRWSPDSTRLLIQDNDQRWRIVRIPSGEGVRLPEGLASCQWQDNKTIVALAETSDGFEIKSLDASGRVLRTTAPKLTEAIQEKIEEETFEGLASFRLIHPLPQQPQKVLVSAIQGDSTHGKQRRYYAFDLATGQMSPYTSGNTLVWDARGTRFATIPTRELAPYGRWPDERGPRTVWVQPLLLGNAAAPEKPRPLVSGLVYVEGCDWR